MIFLSFVSSFLKTSKQSQTADFFQGTFLCNVYFNMVFHRKFRLSNQYVTITYPLMYKPNLNRIKIRKERGEPNRQSLKSQITDVSVNHDSPKNHWTNWQIYKMLLHYNFQKKINQVLVYFLISPVTKKPVIMTGKPYQL